MDKVEHKCLMRVKVTLIDVGAKSPLANAFRIEMIHTKFLQLTESITNKIRKKNSIK